MFDFEWDENKADINYKKHDLSFDDAKSVFDDYFALTVNDKLHSDFEQRYNIIGYTISGMLIALSFTYRGNNIRIISAR